MTEKSRRRLLRDIILEGAPATVPLKKVEEPIAKTPKLHLNIKDAINIYIQKIGRALFPVKGKQHTVGETHTLSDIFSIVKFVVGYGIIGGFVLTMAIMLLPYNLPPLTNWLKGSGITQIAIIVLGMGSLIYLFFDLSKEHEAKNLYSEYLRYKGLVK